MTTEAFVCRQSPNQTQLYFWIAGFPKQVLPSSVVQRQLLFNYHSLHGQSSGTTGPHKLLAQCVPYLTVNVGQTSIIPRQQIACNAACLSELMKFPINV